MNFSLTNACTVSDAESIKQYSFAIHTSIAEVQERIWNMHVPDANLLMQYEYLKLLEETQGDKLGYRYIFAEKEGAIKGLMYFQIVKFEGRDLLNYLPEGGEGFSRYFWNGISWLLKPVFTNLNARMLVSGNIFMTGESGFYFNSEVDKPTRAKLLRKAVEEIKKGDKSISGATISDLYEPKSVFDNDFSLCDFNEVRLEPDMSITLREEWNSFDDYLASLSSKYRVRTKKVLAMCRENEVVQKELSREEIVNYSSRMYQLYQLVMQKADFKLGTFTQDNFARQKEQLPDNYRVYGYFKDGEMLSFISFFMTGTKMDVHYVGMDENKCKPIHLYQHMLYDIIKTGIENKIQRLHFGRTATEIKSTVGAVPSPTYGYVKHFNPIINWAILRPLTRRMKPKEYVYRNPFK